MNGHTVTQEDHDAGRYVDAPVGSVVSMEAETATPEAPLEGQAMPDLDKLRDERCIPIAKDLIKLMATDLIPEGSDVIDHHVLVKKFLERFLDADLNITSEVPYVPQLILGVLGGLNRTMQSVDFAPIDEARYDSIARKILAVVAEADVRMTDVTPEEVDADFAPVKEKINAILAVEKLNMMEIKYIMDNIFTAFSTVEGFVNLALEKSSANAEAKLFGIADMTDLSMKRLDQVLKARTEMDEEARERLAREEQ